VDSRKLLACADRPKSDAERRHLPGPRTCGGPPWPGTASRPPSGRLDLERALNPKVLFVGEIPRW
jgi:hypothetical protein